MVIFNSYVKLPEGKGGWNLLCGSCRQHRKLAGPPLWRCSLLRCPWVLVESPGGRPSESLEKNSTKLLLQPPFRPLRQTFNSYNWHLLFLIGGGSALGWAARAATSVWSETKMNRIMCNIQWIYYTLPYIIIHYNTLSLLLLSLIIFIHDYAAIS
jgi:hypothetical protein